MHHVLQLFSSECHYLQASCDCGEHSQDCTDAADGVAGGQDDDHGLPVAYRWEFRILALMHVDLGFGLPADDTTSGGKAGAAYMLFTNPVEDKHAGQAIRRCVAPEALGRRAHACGDGPQVVGGPAWNLHTP